MSADRSPTPGSAARPWGLVALGTVAALGVGVAVLPALRLDRDVSSESLAGAGETPAAESPVPAADQGPSNEAADPPAFDLVRKEDDGTTLVAGKARPRSEVSLVIDGVTRARTTSDALGQFVVFVALERSAEARVMWLLAQDPGGEMRPSADTVILAPDDGSVPAPVLSVERRPRAGIAPPQDDAAPSGATVRRAAMPGPAPFDLADAGPGTVAERVSRLAVETSAADGAGSDVAAQNDARPAPEAPKAAGSAPPAALAQPPNRSAPALLSDAEGVRVMQSPPLQGAGQVRLDTLDYGVDGAVVLRGRAASGGTVTARLDGVVRGQVTPDAGGGWSLRLTDVSPGDYALTVARRDADGTVSSTARIPFRRASPDAVTAALSGSAARVVTVQPGATLWAIARDRYGDGTRYVQVFDANREAIGDPDLIYPGQVFELPEPSRP